MSREDWRLNFRNWARCPRASTVLLQTPNKGGFPVESLLPVHWVHFSESCCKLSIVTWSWHSLQRVTLCKFLHTLNRKIKNCSQPSPLSEALLPLPRALVRSLISVCVPLLDFYSWSLLLTHKRWHTHAESVLGPKHKWVVHPDNQYLSVMTPTGPWNLKPGFWLNLNYGHQKQKQAGIVYGPFWSCRNSIWPHTLKKHQEI